MDEKLFCVNFKSCGNVRRRLHSPCPCHSECNIIPFNVVDIIKSMLYYALAATPYVEEMSPSSAHTISLAAVCFV